MEVRLPFLRRGIASFFNISICHKSLHQITLFHLNHDEIITAMWILLIIYFKYEDSNIDLPMKEYSTINNQFNNTATNSFQKNSLWKQSEATIPYVAPQLSFSKEKRFKWSSIYWPEINANDIPIKKNQKSEINQLAIKVSKLIDEEEKNEERIKKLKKTFSIGKSQKASARKEINSIVSMKKPFRLNSQNQLILKRLLPAVSKHQSLLRDRHGNRCNMFDNPQTEETTKLQDRFLSNSTGFKTSRKMKLQLPHNYYPGPGKYEIKRYLAELDEKSNSYFINKSERKISDVKS